VWRLVPGCGWGHVGEHLVHWHLDRGDAAAAERVARRVHDIELANIEDPYQRAAAIYNLGCFYARNGRPAEAVPLVIEALDRAPDLRGWAQEDPDLVTIRHLLPTNEEVPAMSTTDDLLRRNAAYAASFTKGDLALPPARKVAVLACMDARLDVHKILGLEEGDAHVIRNAGGVVTEDAIRSLVISQRLLGTDEVILIHHTDCGMLTFTDDQVKAQIEADTGIRPAFALEAFGDLDADVRQSIARIKASPFVPRKDGVRGFVYDVHTGRLAEVS
jgi:carbonic anhydrase